ncbi:MAG: hypothetical protein AB7U61_12775 [Methylocystis sp.]
MTQTALPSFTYCQSCGSRHEWRWEEAFDKFGFGDGDGLVMTDEVARILIEAGYTVTTEHWGMHNVIITSIKRSAAEQIPEKAILGYDDPRGYLPAAIVSLLDSVLNGKEV